MNTKWSFLLPHCETNYISRFVTNMNFNFPDSGCGTLFLPQFGTDRKVVCQQWRGIPENKELEILKLLISNSIKTFSSLEPIWKYIFTWLTYQIHQLLWFLMSVSTLLSKKTKQNLTCCSKSLDFFGGVSFWNGDPGLLEAASCPLSCEDGLP